MAKDPLLYPQSIANIRREIEEALVKSGSPVGGSGNAMIHLFGHFADVIVSRLNRVPEQHMRAFLNEAEVERLPARPAHVELTFSSAADGAAAIHVPTGTQVATRPSDNQPEIIFETERDLVVVPTKLDTCIVVDAVNWSDRSKAIRGEIDESFAIFKGDVERERILYVGHDTLLSFPDVASRQNATIVLNFSFERSGNPNAGDPDASGAWRLEWLFWDGKDWQQLTKAGAKITDETEQFTRNGDVRIQTLPELHKTTLAGDESVWLQCRLTGGTNRRHLPKVRDIQIFREIRIPLPTQAEGMALLENVASVPDGNGKVAEHLLCFGHERLLSFLDPNCRKRAIITLRPQFERHGSATDDGWKLQWLYWNGTQWANLEEASALVIDETKQLRRDGSIRFTQLPDLTESEVNGVGSVWIAARLTGKIDPATLPMLKAVAIEQEVPAETADVNAVLAAVQAGTAFIPLEVTGPFLPLGSVPIGLDSFYLQIDEAFTKPGATVKIEFVLAGLADEIDDMTELDKLRIEWEYFGSDGWTVLGHSIRGCPTLVAYNFEEVGLTNPIIRTNPLTRAKIIEFEAPAGFDEADLQGPRQNGKIVTDIYTDVRYVQFPLPKECENLPQEILLTGCYKAERLNFRDRSCAFTARGAAAVQFDIPAPGDAPLFVPTEVDGRIGYWLRARLQEGSYNVPQKVNKSLVGLLTFQPEQFLPPKSYPPVVEQMKVTYANYRAKEDLQRVPRCKSKTDALWKNHAATPDKWQPFEPFSTPVHLQEPGLYAGFNPLEGAVGKVAFPTNKWIQMRVETDDNDQAEGDELAWQYWNGKTWSNLRVADDTVDLMRSGYLGFYGPADHQKSTEFGIDAYWLRILPLSVVEATNTRSDPSKRGAPVAQAAATTRLRRLRLNTIPAVNAVTIIDELLGFSNGEADQPFKLAHTPILPDIELDVREPEVHNESVHTAAQTTNSLVAGQPVVQPLASDQNVPSHEEWVRWQPMTSFYGCGPDSRCYLLDPINGEIRFGNGKHGRIPPPGRDNIRVKRYRTHSATASNLESNTITVLRNPSAALSDIQSVTNLATAVGGVEAEVVEQVKRRGPQSLKHRQQPVMAEDYQWITLEADNVARAHCLPTRNPQGKRQPGWVTVVVVPQSNAVKPIPSPSLLRQIRSRLESVALANLRQFEFVDAGDTKIEPMIDVDQIQVIGPQYLEVQIHSEIMPTVPEKGDEVQLDVLRRLEAFMHPLSGGPDRNGWEPGRDVHISEVAAEIESVSGVDHVATLTLSAAGIQQKRLTLDGKFRASFDMEAGSVVSTFDGRIRMVLAKSWSKCELAGELMVYGFKIDDLVTILTADGEPIATNLKVARVENDQDEIYFVQTIAGSAFKAQPDQQLILQGTQVVLEIEQNKELPDAEGKPAVVGVVVRGFSAGELVSVIQRERPRQRENFLPVLSVNPILGLSRIYVPDDHLVASGLHEVKVVLGVQHGDTIA